MTVRPFLRLVAILVASILCVAGGMAGFVALSGKLALSRLEARSGILKAEYVPLRFMLLSRSDATVSARIFLYDADGGEIASFERSWNGSELDFETVLVPVAGRGLAFPVRISADSSSPRGGTDLTGYYDKRGFPAVSGSVLLDDAARGAVSAVFRSVKLFGGPVRDVRRLRGAEIGVVYALAVRFPGGVSLERN
jgi:hypothetical protein